MQRVLIFLEWQAVWWEDRATLHTNLSPEDAEGVAAYAAKQASIRQSLRSRFDTLWRSGWKLIYDGIGADNEISELGSDTSHITSYPSTDIK